MSLSRTERLGCCPRQGWDLQVALPQLLAVARPTARHLVPFLAQWVFTLFLISDTLLLWFPWEENVTSTVYLSQLRVWVSAKLSLLTNLKGFLGTVETLRCGSPDPRGPPELTAQSPLPPAAHTPAPSSSKNHGVRAQTVSAAAELT